MTFARQYSCPTECQGSACHLFCIWGRRLDLGSHFYALNPEKIFSAPLIPILHILCSVGFLNVVDSNLFGWKLRKHNPSSTLCVLIFVCFAFAGWGLFRDWWCGGGLVPFYETYEDKPRSCCSFLWESCERHHKFLFLPIFCPLLRVSTALWPSQQNVSLLMNTFFLRRIKNCSSERLQLHDTGRCASTFCSRNPKL